MRARLVTLILAAGVSLGGCAYGGGYGGLSVGANYGDPYGYGYGSYGSPYGYAGYGGYDPFSRYNPYYRSPYYGSPYYGSPYLGWYDSFYYPGTGYYIYDRSGERRRLNEQDRKRWVQGIAEMAAATAARNGQPASASTSTQSGASIAPKPDVIGSSGDLATQVRERARTTERRATTRTVRSAPSKSTSLGATIRRRVSSED